MKIIISENKLERTVINWLDNEFGDLTPYKTGKYPHLIFYMKDDKVIFEYDVRYSDVYLSYEHIWEFLTNFFNMDYIQIQNTTKKWIKGYYNLEVKTIYLNFFDKERFLPKNNTN